VLVFRSLVTASCLIRFSLLAAGLRRRHTAG
jgi:hypothetical protein